MVRRTYKKPHRARRKKPLWKKPFFWRSLVLTGGAGGAVWLVCFSPALEVKEIRVDGTQKIDNNVCAKLIEEEVAKKIALFDSKSILLFDMDQAKKELMARFPQAQNIKIERQFPSKIIASVQERRGVAVFNDGANRWLVDDNGIAFEESAAADDLLEITAENRQIKPGERALDKNTLNQILFFKGEMSDFSNIEIESAFIAANERINFKMKDGGQIYFNPLRDTAAQLEKLKAVVSDETFKQKRPNLEYIDIRFTRVYLKEKTQD